MNHQEKSILILLVKFIMEKYYKLNLCSKINHLDLSCSNGYCPLKQ